MKLNTLQIQSLKNHQISELEDLNLEPLEGLPCVSRSHEVLNKVLYQKKFWSQNGEKPPTEHTILTLPTKQWSHNN